MNAVGGGDGATEEGRSRGRLAAREAKALAQATRQARESPDADGMAEGEQHSAEGDETPAEPGVARRFAVDDVDIYWSGKRRLGSQEGPLSRGYWLEQQDRWECHCGYLNAPTEGHCHACSTQRDGGGADEEATSVLPFLAGEAIETHVKAVHRAEGGVTAHAGTERGSTFETMPMDAHRSSGRIQDESGTVVGAYFELPSQLLATPLQAAEASQSRTFRNNAEFDIGDQNHDGVLDREEYARFAEAKAAVEAVGPVTVEAILPRASVGQAESRLRDLVGWAYRQRGSPSQAGHETLAQESRR